MSPNKPLPSSERRSSTTGVFPPWTRLGDRRGKSPVVSPIVTIFGAGISGLSAAHELIERGFSVQVVEPTQSPEEEYAAEVGGMAANQFGRVKEKPEVLHGPQPTDEDELARFRDNVSRVLLQRSAEMQRVQPRFATPWRIQFIRRRDGTPDDGEVNTNLVDEWGSQNGLKLVAALETFKAAITAYQGVDVRDIGSWRNSPHDAEWREWIRRETLRVEIRGHTNRDDTEENNRALSLKWAEAVRDRLIAINDTESASKIPNIESHFRCVGVGSAEPLGDQRDEVWRARSNRVEFRIIEQLVPGEHGYRFFPAFYRHLFDTMQRTPILNEHDQETGETAFDRLVPTRDFGLGLRDGRSTVSIQTRRLRSLEELRKHSQDFFQRLGATFRDIARFEVRMLKFLTSSSERRQREYEGQSWWTFLGGASPQGYSEKMRKFLTETPQALVAMNAEETDARSQGNIVSQLQIHYLENQFDSTLNGPTTSVWLREWKRYLERQGVRFFVGELGKLAWDRDDLVPVTTHRSGWLEPRRRRADEVNREADDPPKGGVTPPDVVATVDSGAVTFGSPGVDSINRLQTPPKPGPPLVRPAQPRIHIEVMGHDEGDYAVFVDERAFSVTVRHGMTTDEIALKLGARVDTDPAVCATVKGSRITISEAREVRPGKDAAFDASYVAGTWKDVKEIRASAAKRPLTEQMTKALDQALSEALETRKTLRFEESEWVYAGVRRARQPEFDQKLSQYEQTRRPRCEIVPRISVVDGSVVLAPPEWVLRVSREEGDRAADFAPLFPYYFRTRKLAPSILIRVKDPHDNLRILGDPMPENPNYDYRSHLESQPAFRPDFYVLALPFEAASKLVWQAESERPGHLDGCLAELLKFDICAHRRSQSGRPLLRTRDSQGRPAKEDPLRDFSGIQYYFHNQVRIGKGHIYFPDAEWGLSSISQLAYWRERMSASGAFMGQLSVDIGNLYATAPPRGGGRFTWSAWNSTADEIAREVWYQVRQGLEKDRAGVLADPDFVHLDDGLRFDHPLGSSFRETASIVVAEDEEVVDAGHRAPYTVWVNGERFTYAPESRESASRIAGALSDAINGAKSGRLVASARTEEGPFDLRPSAIVGKAPADAIDMVKKASGRQLDDLQDEERRNPRGSRLEVLEAIYARRKSLELAELGPETIVQVSEPDALDMIAIADIDRLEALQTEELKHPSATGGRPSVTKAITDRRAELRTQTEEQPETGRFVLRITSTVPFEGALVSVTGTEAGSYELVIGGKPYRHVQTMGAAEARGVAGLKGIRDALFDQIVLDADATVVPEASGTAGLVLLPKGLKLPRIEVCNEHQNLSLVFGPKLHIRLEQCHEGLAFENPQQATVGYNGTPFLINVPGQWRHRPGVVVPGVSQVPAIGPGDAPANAVCYHVSNRRWVAAGTFMATTTRLTTMEAANESARHAVNAILYHLVAGPEGTYSGQGKMFADWADIWDPEKHELDDLEPLKRLDQKLCQEGLPHVLDILKVIEAVDALPMHGQESRDPMGNVMHLIEHAGETLGCDWGFAKELLSGLLAQGTERAREGIDPLGVLRGLKGALPADISERLQRAVKSFMEGSGT